MRTDITCVTVACFAVRADRASAVDGDARAHVLGRDGGRPVHDANHGERQTPFKLRAQLYGLDTNRHHGGRERRGACRMPLLHFV